MTLPSGAYTQVQVINPLDGGILLNNGTGTSSATGVFSCGNFAASDYPKYGGRYKIVAYVGKNRSEDALFCVATGHQTCQFQETKP
jgi:hypothetical protein